MGRDRFNDLGTSANDGGYYNEMESFYGNNNNNRGYVRQQSRSPNRDPSRGQSRSPGNNNYTQHPLPALPRQERGTRNIPPRQASSRNHVVANDSQHTYTRYPEDDYGKKNAYDTSQSQDMQSFMADVEAVKAGITKVRQNVNSMEDLHKQALGATRPQEKNAFSRKIDMYQADTSDLINQLRNSLKKLKSAAAQNKGADHKICTTQTQGLAKKLMDVAHEYQKMQLKFKDKYKQRMEREIRIANPYASEAEVHQAVESGGSGFAQQMMSSTGQQRQALKDVQARHNEILNIEKSVTELFDLFQEMQILLEEQQETIDIIDSHVIQAEDQVSSGNSHLTKAVYHRKKSRKRMWYILLCVFICLVIIGLVIFLKAKHFI